MPGVSYTLLLIAWFGISGWQLFLFLMDLLETGGHGFFEHDLGLIIAMYYSKYAAPIGLMLLWSSAYYRFWYTAGAMFVPAVVEIFIFWKIWIQW